MRYVADIDGTICTPGPDKETRYTGATPIQSRIDLINKLHDEGNYVVYLTARGMGTYKNSTHLAYENFYKFTLSQLLEWGCKFDELHMGKPSGDHYIDDKGIFADEFFSQL